MIAAARWSARKASRASRTSLPDDVRRVAIVEIPAIDGRRKSMLRISAVLAAGTLLLGIASASASAPAAGSQVVSTPIVNLAQYDGGGRCFNRCVRGRIFRRCQNDPQAKRESCCSVACSRYYNLRFYDWDD
jgi:hypothetical protein